MFLFAQTPPGFDWEKVLAGYGPLGVIAIIFFGFVLWYGRRMADGHLTLVESLKEWMAHQQICQQTDNELKERTTTTLEKLCETQTLTESRGNKHARTLRVLVANAQEMTSTQKQLVQSSQVMQVELSKQTDLQQKLHEKVDQLPQMLVQIVAPDATKIEHHDHPKK